MQKRKLNRDRSYQKIVGEGDPPGIVFSQDGIPFDHLGVEILVEDRIATESVAETSTEDLKKLADEKRKQAEAKDKTIADLESKIAAMQKQMKDLGEDLKLAQSGGEVDLDKIPEFGWNEDTPIDDVLEYVAGLKKDELIAFDRDHFDGQIPNSAKKADFLAQLRERIGDYYSELEAL